MFEVRMAEEVPAVAVVPLNKSNCTLDKRNLKDGSSEVWKHFGYYASKLKLDANWVKEHPICIHCFSKWKDEDVDPKKWEISIGKKKSTSHMTTHMMTLHRELHDADILVKSQAAGRKGSILKFAKPTGGQNATNIFNYRCYGLRKKESTKARYHFNRGVFVRILGAG